MGDTPKPPGRRCLLHLCVLAVILSGVKNLDEILRSHGSLRMTYKV